MAYELFVPPSRALDANGNPLSGAKWFFYLTGTTTPATVYTSSALSVALPNPVVADAGGLFADIYCSPATTYRAVLKDAAEATTYLDIDPLPQNAFSALAAATGAGLIGYDPDETYPAGSVGLRMQHVIYVTDYGATGDGTTNDSPAFIAAVAALPATGGTIVVPDALGYKLDAAIATGTKPVRWMIGHTNITCPAGDFAFKLQSNGSSIHGAGQDATFFTLRTPTTPVVYPTVAVTRVGGAITAATPSGSSGIVSCPVVLIAKSPANDVVGNDAGTVAYFGGGQVTSLMASGLMGATGADYVSDPSFSFLGGGAGAVLMDNVQYADVGGFTVDFDSIAGSTGVVHRGGWYCNVFDVAAFYDKATGVTSEHATSIILLVDSYTLGAPGDTGGYGGVYICRYRNISGSKRAVIGHDTSTATTLHFDTCDFKNSYIHAAIGVKDTNVVTQGNIADAGSTPYYYDLLNVDGLHLDLGDLEGDRHWVHFVGSCSNIIVEPLAYAASGVRYRGIPGPGTHFNPRKSNASGEFPLMAGSLSAGLDMINAGFVTRHRYGIAYDGDKYVVGASNIRPTSDIAGVIDDIAKGAIYTYTTAAGVFGGRVATAGVNPRTTTQLFEFASNGLSLPSAAGVRVNGVQVLGSQGAAIADVTTGGGATAAANATAINSILARLRAHGAIAT